MNKGLFAVFAAWCVMVAVLASRPDGTVIAQARPAAAASSDHAAVLKQYCITCHNERAKTGGLVLDPADLASIPAKAEVWEKVIRKVRAGMMPPVGSPRPEAASLDRLVMHLETTID